MRRSHKEGLKRNRDIVWFSICVSAILACGVSNSDRPARDVVFEPGFVDFDSVSIMGQRILPLRITVYGDEFDITDARTSSGKFRFLISQALGRGLADGESGVLQIRYRPCPEAWDSDDLFSGFDFSKCSRRSDEGRLRVIDGRYGWATDVALLGRPAAPGSLEIACTAGSVACLAQNPSLVSPCSRINFGMVTNGEFCQTVIEMRNVAGTDAEPVYIKAFSVQVAGVENGKVFDGQAVGFTGLPKEPFSIAPGASKRIELKFKPTVQGQWTGKVEDGLGLSVFTDSSGRHPAKSIELVAMSSAPRLEIYPAVLNIARKSPGTRQIVTLTLSNSGNESLSVFELRLSESQALRVMTPTPLMIAPGASQDIKIIYFGSDQTFTAELMVVSSDLRQSKMAIELRIQPVPKLCVTPAPLLEIISEVGDLHFSNCGDGELHIRALELVRSDAASSDDSLGDFLVEGCPGGQCEPNIYLCSDNDASCRISSTVFHVVYDNEDNSSFDLASLIIHSNDPDAPEQRITLKGINGTGRE